MRLTVHTDYGLRLLMFGALTDPRPVSIDLVSRKFSVSRHHMMKVAQSLTKAGWIEPVRGPGGGFRLAKPARAICVGSVVRSLETDFGIVECMRNTETGCPIVPCCRLPKLLNKATDAFLTVLDSCTLAELVTDNESLTQILVGSS